MRKPTFCVCENKDADQLRGSLCFCYIDSTIPLVPKYEISSPCHLVWLYSLVCVTDLVGNPENRFSHNEAQLYLDLIIVSKMKSQDMQCKYCRISTGLIVSHLV